MEISSRMFVLITDMLLSDKSNRDVYENASRILRAAVEDLPEMEKRVIKMAYSLDEDNNDTYETLALEYDVPLDEIYAAQTSALRRLRKVDIT